MKAKQTTCAVLKTIGFTVVNIIIATILIKIGLLIAIDFNVTWWESLKLGILFRLLSMFRFYDSSSK